MKTAIVALVWGALGLFGMSILGDVVKKPPVRMDLASLEYKDGKFHQHVSVTGGPIRGMWTAEIYRNGVDGNKEHLCSGGGIAPYNGDPSGPMPPDIWVGADCPELRSGDYAEAIWEYQDETGLTRREVGRLQIP